MSPPPGSDSMTHHAIRTANKEHPGLAKNTCSKAADSRGFATTCPGNVTSRFHRLFPVEEILQNHQRNAGF
eukprot:12938677-Prorocentrum_lima.AAC.1